MKSLAPQALRAAGVFVPYAPPNAVDNRRLRAPGSPWRRTLLLTLCNWILPGITRAEPPFWSGGGRVSSVVVAARNWQFCGGTRARFAAGGEVRRHRC